MSNRQYTYYAFISYKHEDVKWAKWLQHRLQSYRLPVRTRKQYQQLPQRLSPVFYDKNLRPGILRAQIREEVQSSRFLIVLCSRRSKAEPDWLNEEINCFLEGGGTRDRIIPVIVDKTEHPVMETFPSRLAELNREQTILGVNLPADGRHRSTLKIVSYMQGIKIEELESEDSRRRKKKGLLITAAAFLALCLAAYAGFRWWDYYVPKTAYYADYVERRGIPEGVGKRLSDQEILGMSAHYAIISCHHRVQQVRYENSYGRLISVSSIGIPRYPRTDYAYAGDSAALDSVIYYDENDHPVMEMAYDRGPYAADLRRAGTEGAAPAGSFLRARTVSVGMLDETDETSSISRYLFAYDENGFMTELLYSSNSNYNTVAVDADGIAGLRFERDSEGRERRVLFLTFTGPADGAAETGSDSYAVHVTRDGICGFEYEYDASGRTEVFRYLGRDLTPVSGPDQYAVMTLAYDKNGNTILRRYYDSGGNPCLSAEKTAGRETAYDDRGNPVSSIDYDTDWNPVLNFYGFCGERLRYDESGRLVRIDFLDTSGSPVLSKLGYASMTMAYDEKDGTSTTMSVYRDTEDKPVTGIYGSAMVRNIYDSQGNLTEKSYLDADGNPALISDGYAAVTYNYKGNRLVEESYLGKDGNPVLNQNWYATRQYEYDARGNRCREANIGVNGEPVLNRDGVARIDTVFDDNGHCVRTAYYGTDGNPILGSDGYAVLECEYDLSGNRTKERFLGTDGNPVLNNQWYAATEMSYDALGNRTGTVLSGTDGNPCLCRDGYASWQKTFDEHGNMLSQAWFDTQGSPAASSEGYAVLRREYNSRGSITAEYYYDETGKHTLSGSGWAGFLREYDDREQDITISYLGLSDEAGTPEVQSIVRIDYDSFGNRIRETVYDRDGNPAVSSKGFARAEHDYDERGNMIRSATYGADGTLVADPQKGYAVVKQEYDEYNRVIREAYYDAGNMPVEDFFGVHAYSYEYDQRGNLNARHFLGRDGNPAVSDAGYSTMEMAYDECGNNTEIRYLDEQGRLQDGGLGGFAVRKNEYDEKGQWTAESYYDADGRPTVAQGGFAREEFEYDDRGHKICTVLIGTDGLPVMSSLGYSICRCEFDVRGDLVAERYYDTQDQPVLIPQGYFAEISEYDSRHNRISISFLDTEGNPVMSVHGYARSEREYNLYGRMVKETRYDAGGEILP